MVKDIRQLLPTLLADLGNSVEAVIQIIDNSNNCDGIKEVLAQEFPTVHYLDALGNIGFGKAQNLGMATVPADFYLVLNPDIIFPAGQPAGQTVIKTLLDYLEANPAVGIVAPRLTNTDGSLQPSSLRFNGLLDQIARRLEWGKYSRYIQNRVNRFLMTDYDHQSTQPVDWLTGAFLLVRGETMRALGGFDQRFFMYLEDCDLCRRSWLLGQAVHYFPALYIIHGHRRGSSGQSAWRLVLYNKVTRIHLKSWLKYFAKWGLRAPHYGR